MPVAAPPYTVTATLYESDGVVLCRAIRTEDRRPVLLRVLGPRRPQARDLARLEHEHRIAGRLEGAAVARPLAVDRHEGMPALVMEDFSGRPLATLVGAPMDPGRFLPIAL